MKVSTFIYRHLQGNPGQQRFTIRSGVLTGSDTSGAAPVAAVHCQNERTLDPAVCSQTDHLCPSQPQYGLHPAMFSGNDSLFFETSIILPGTNCYSFTYPEGMEGRVGLSIMSVNNLLKVITRQRSWWNSNPRPLSHWSEILPSYHYATEP